MLAIHRKGYCPCNAERHSLPFASHALSHRHAGPPIQLHREKECGRRIAITVLVLRQNTSGRSDDESPVNTGPTAARTGAQPDAKTPRVRGATFGAVTRQCGRRESRRCR